MFIWFWDQVPGNKSLGSKSPKGTHVLLAFKINSLEQKSGGQKFSRNSCPFSFEKNLKNQNLGNKRHLGNKCPFSFGNKSLGNKSLEKKVLRPIIPQYRISVHKAGTLSFPTETLCTELVLFKLMLLTGQSSKMAAPFNLAPLANAFVKPAITVYMLGQ